MEYCYKLNCGQYVLHDGDKPIGPVLDEVAIAFDRESATLHKHGSPEMVMTWYRNALAKYRQAGLDDMADNLAVITGRFDLEDLNRCLTHAGYIGHLYDKMAKGEIKALGFDGTVQEPATSLPHP